MISSTNQHQMSRHSSSWGTSFRGGFRCVETSVAHDEPQEVLFLDFVAERISPLFDVVTSLNLPLRFVSKRRSGLSHSFARRRQPPNAIEQVRGFVLRRRPIDSCLPASLIGRLNFRGISARTLCLDVPQHITCQGRDAFERHSVTPLLSRCSYEDQRNERPSQGVEQISQGYGNV